MERKTVQRSIIETELESLANHPTAEEVYAAVHKKHPSIGKATVYRTLSKMAEVESELAQKQRELDELKNSTSHKLGSALMALPCKLKDAVMR